LDHVEGDRALSWFVPTARGLLLLGTLAVAGCLDPTPYGDIPPDEETPEPEDPVAGPSVASFVTWNLKFFPLTSSTPEIVASLLNEWGDDVVAVEEITEPETFMAMVDTMPGYAAVLNDDPGAPLRLGLLYNTDRVRVSNTETLFIDDTWAFPRPPLKADVTITLQAGVLDFTVIVVHLKSQVGDDTAPRRRAAALALDAWVTEHAGVDADQDIVILGDFNEELLAPSETFDIFVGQPQDYRFLTYALNVGDGFSQISYQSFLDHILITTAALDDYGGGTTVVLDPRRVEARYEDLVSDHLPVRALFSPGTVPAP